MFYNFRFFIWVYDPFQVHLYIWWEMQFRKFKFFVYGYLVSLVPCLKDCPFSAELPLILFLVIYIPLTIYLTKCTHTHTHTGSLLGPWIKCISYCGLQSEKFESCWYNGHSNYFFSLSPTLLLPTEFISLSLCNSHSALSFSISCGLQVVYGKPFPFSFVLLCWEASWCGEKRRDHTSSEFYFIISLCLSSKYLVSLAQFFLIWTMKPPSNNLIQFLQEMRDIVCSMCIPCLDM